MREFEGAGDDKDKIEVISKLITSYTNFEDVIGDIRQIENVGIISLFSGFVNTDLIQEFLSYFNPKKEGDAEKKTGQLD